MGSVQESSDQEDAEGFVFSVLFHHYHGRSYPFSSWLYFTTPCSSLSHPLPIIPCPCSASAPAYHAPSYPAPVANIAPAYHAPAYHAPTHPYHAPAPAYHTPAPTYHAPAVHAAPAYHAPEPVYKEEPSPYQYEYGVHDEYSGASFGAAETADGTGNVDGSYSVNLPDGRIQ